MSKAIQCDRCERFESLQKADGREISKPGEWMWLKTAWHYISDEDGFNLCPTCAAQFNNFMNHFKAKTAGER